ncbi:MAG: Wzz/FepE/Etk N-terminal domain-containing protein, partial [Methyloceanibacter sp.]
MSSATHLPPNVQPIRAGAIPAAAFAEEAFDLRRLLAMARRRKALIVGMTTAATVLAGLWVNQITPLYRAEAMIVVEPDRKQVIKIDQVVQNLNPDWLTAQTEAAVIRSRDVGRLAVERLDLANHPAFNPALAPPRRTMGTVLRDWVESGLATVGLAEEPAPAAEPAARSQANPPEPEHLVNAYLGGLEATPVERSRLIRIVYTSTDPLLAAAAANMAAELYIEEQHTSKGKATTDANTWLDRRVGEVHAQVIEAQRQRDEFRRKAGIVELSDSSIYVEQLALLNIRLVEARSARQQTEAR